MLSTATKLDMLFCVTQQKLFTWKWLCVLYLTVIKTSVGLSYSSRNKQNCTSCWNSNVQHISYIICCLSQESLILKKKKSLLVITVYVTKCVAFYSLKNTQDWLYVEHIHFTNKNMPSMLCCGTQTNNSSLGTIYVDHIL